jgi:hypothetical protein
MASAETIRRILRGTTVPAHWETVEAVYLTLCDLAELDPDDDVYLDALDERAKIRRHVEETWHEALDNPNHRYRQPARVAAEDPWAADAGSFGVDRASDEPPF